MTGGGRPVEDNALEGPVTMLHISVNGEARECAADTRLGALLHTLGIAGKKIAVERNGEIVPRSQHADTVLAEGDRLEIVVAVGGG